MTLIGQHARSGDYVSENIREVGKNGNVDKIVLRTPRPKTKKMEVTRRIITNFFKNYFFI